MANILPVAFVVWIIATIWFLYLWLHLGHLLGHKDAGLRTTGIWQAAVSQGLFAMLVVCFARAVLTDPGSVPETAEWSGRGEAERRGEKRMSLEVKQTGERRFCKWCDHYKPDRAHHCRVCRSCILRMDHHCPWIANCVGFANHKYFFLLVFYALLNCAFVLATMWSSIRRAAQEEMLAGYRFLTVFGATLALIMAVLLKFFLSIHVVLMLKAQTTIEYCEKRSRKTFNAVSYDVGVLHNVKAVLGPNPLLWLLPLSPPEGQGTHFQIAPKQDGEQADSHSPRAPLAAQKGVTFAAASPLAAAAAAQSEVKPQESEAALEPEVTGAKAAAA